MRWSNVMLEAVASELPAERVATRALEARLGPLYAQLKLQPGQVEALTGIVERRMWPQTPRRSMADCAAAAARKALDSSGIDPGRLGAVLYAGVCRDNLEPATACAVAEQLGVAGDATVADVSNACLGVLNGMVDVANRIELGQIDAGLVVSAESSREIVDATIARLNAEPTHERFRLGLATLTGGSGATAVLLTRAGFGDSEHRLVGGVALAEPKHHRICRWGPTQGLLGETVNVMDTDASQVLEHGVALGARTWERFLGELGWRAADVDRVICHQVGAGHRTEVLATIGVDETKDFSTFRTLGNMGTASVPVTLEHALAEGFVRPGQRLGLLGIGSGLNCLMLGVHW